MGICRVMNIFEGVSGLPEDRYVNVFHFITPGGDVSEADGHLCNGAVAAAYQQDGFGGQKLHTGFSSALSRATPPKLKAYNVEQIGGKWVGGSPIAEDVWAGNLAVFNGVQFPGEVSLCLSFHGDLTADLEVVPQEPEGPKGDLHPKARKRGRVYLPYASNWSTSVDAGGVVRPNTTLRETVCAMGTALKNNAALAGANIDWAVFSKTSGTLVPVVGGWCDDEFDTQRRRGATRTTRTTF